MIPTDHISIDGVCSNDINNTSGARKPGVPALSALTLPNDNCGCCFSDNWSFVDDCVPRRCFFFFLRLDEDGLIFSTPPSLLLLPLLLPPSKLLFMDGIRYSSCHLSSFNFAVFGAHYLF